MQKLGLNVMVINGDTLAEGRLHGEDLWAKARTDSTVSMHIMNPEQLSSKGFETLLKDDDYLRRTCLLGVDEVHMINTWGLQFRKAFRQIGFIRARFFDDTVVMALTATLRKGKPVQSVCNTLGFREGQFHLIRRSNLRHDIQIIFREVQSPIGGTRFPELDWILEERQKTFVFARTIHLGFRVFTYLYQKSSHDPNVSNRIRMYNALNWSSHNSETRELMAFSVTRRTKMTWSKKSEGSVLIVLAQGLEV
jgi:superfamily II DNA helicase RecQ